MSRPQHPKRAEALRLLATGLSVVKVSRKLSIPRTTISRWRSEGQGSTGDTNGHVSGAPDWRELREEAVQGLQQGVREGKATAAVALTRLAQQQLESGACNDHVLAADVRAEIFARTDIWVAHLLGPLVRELSQATGTSEAEIGVVVRVRLEEIRKELNMRYRQTEEAQA